MPTDEQILSEAIRLVGEGVQVTLPVNGRSMYPFIIGGRESVVLVKPQELRVGHVVLARVEGGTLTNDECAYLVQSVGSALAYAHENGVLHLDIKPSNIMFERDGTIKLCDFGMATLASAAGYGGARGGTVGYMPPEQITGDLVDERCDVFALAVVCWQALTGENPFAAPTAEESLRRIERGPRREISQVDPDVTGMASEAIMQAISPNPALRPPSVEAFSNEVAFALGDPDAGGQSIKSLMLQSTDDSVEETEGYIREQLPIAYRYPWLADVIVRFATALTTGWSCFATSGAWAGTAGNAPIAIACGAAVLTAIWSPVGSLLAFASLMAAMLMSTSSAAATFWTISLVTAFGIWWVMVGRTDRLSACSLVLPSCASNALLAAPLAGFSLTPARAGATAVLSAYISSIVSTVSTHGFGADAAIASLTLGQLNPRNAAAYVVVGLAALLCATITTHWGSVRSSALGQLACMAVILFAQIFFMRVENGDIWAAASWIHVAVAVLLSVLLCIMAVIRGPLPTAEEV